MHYFRFPLILLLQLIETFGTSKNTPFWLFLAPPAHPVEFFWFKMAGKGIPHIDTVPCWTRTSRGSFRPQYSVFSKKAIFCCFLAKKWGSLTRERLVEMNFFYKIRWLVHSILAREPKFHADWFRNGRATRKKPKNGP